MKKTSVMIEVSEDLYNEVVEPYKKKKGFGKLVVQLLEAYRTNDSIYSYINGTMDGLENEATEELLKDLNDMANSLNMFGVLHSQAEAVIDEGQRAFDEFGSQAKKDSFKYQEKQEEVVKEDILTKEDVVNIVNDSVSEIKSMIENLLNNRDMGNNNVKETVNEVQKVVETKINTDLGEAVNRDNAPKEVYTHVEQNKPTKEDESKASSVLSSLMDSVGGY